MRGRRNPNKPPLANVLPSCRVCGEPSTGFHYGVTTCGACKGFFRRCLSRSNPYPCSKSQLCHIGPLNKRRKLCPKCRYDKCVKVGMSIQGCRVGRYSRLNKTEYETEALKQIKLQGDEKSFPESQKQQQSSSSSSSSSSTAAAISSSSQPVTSTSTSSSPSSSPPSPASSSYSSSFSSPPSPSSSMRRLSTSSTSSSSSSSSSSSTTSSSNEDYPEIITTTTKAHNSINDNNNNNNNNDNNNDDNDNVDYWMNHNDYYHRSFINLTVDKDETDDMVDDGAKRVFQNNNNLLQFDVDDIDDEMLTAMSLSNLNADDGVGSQYRIGRNLSTLGSNPKNTNADSQGDCVLGNSNNDRDFGRGRSNAENKTGSGHFNSLNNSPDENHDTKVILELQPVKRNSATVVNNGGKTMGTSRVQASPTCRNLTAIKAEPQLPVATDHVMTQSSASTSTSNHHFQKHSFSSSSSSSSLSITSSSTSISSKTTRIPSHKLNATPSSSSSSTSSSSSSSSSSNRGLLIKNATTKSINSATIIKPPNLSHHHSNTLHTRPQFSPSHLTAVSNDDYADSTIANFLCTPPPPQPTTTTITTTSCFNPTTHSNNPTTSSCNYTTTNNNNTTTTNNNNTNNSGYQNPLISYPYKEIPEHSETIPVNFLATTTTQQSMAPGHSGMNSMTLSNSTSGSTSIPISAGIAPCVSSHDPSPCFENPSKLFESGAWTVDRCPSTNDMFEFIIGRSGGGNDVVSQATTAVFQMDQSAMRTRCDVKPMAVDFQEIPSIADSDNDNNNNNHNNDTNNTSSIPATSTTTTTCTSTPSSFGSFFDSHPTDIRSCDFFQLDADNQNQNSPATAQTQTAGIGVSFKNDSNTTLPSSSSSSLSSSLSSAAAAATTAANSLPLSSSLSSTKKAKVAPASSTSSSLLTLLSVPQPPPPSSSSSASSSSPSSLSKQSKINTLPASKKTPSTATITPLPDTNHHHHQHPHHHPHPHPQPAFTLYDERFPLRSFEKSALEKILSNCSIAGDLEKLISPPNLKGNPSAHRPFHGSSKRFSQLQYPGDTKRVSHYKQNLSGTDFSLPSSSSLSSSSSSSFSTLLETGAWFTKADLAYSCPEMDSLYSQLQQKYTNSYGDEACRLSDLDITSAQDMYWKYCSLQERLQGPLKLISDDAYYNILESVGIDMDGRKAYFSAYLDCFDHHMLRDIRFFRQLPGFKHLTLRDRTSLTKSCMFIYLCIRGFRGWDRHRRITVGENGQFGFCIDKVTQIFPNLQETVDRLLAVMEELQDLGPSRQETILIQALMVVTPYTHESLEEPEMVHTLHKKYLTCLLHLIRKTRGVGPQADARFASFVDILEAVKDLRLPFRKFLRDSVEQMLKLIDSENVVMFREMFTYFKYDVGQRGDEA